MPKNKRPAPRKHAPTSRKVAEDDDDLQAQALVDAAVALAEVLMSQGRDGDGEDDDADLEDHADVEQLLATLDEELNREIRNALRKRNDDVLYGALERASLTDEMTYQLLRGRIEQAASALLLHREGEAALEVNAFAVPVFVQSIGGLKSSGDFTDGDAFDALVQSFKEHQLESPDAKVVLLSHSYDRQELDRITYSQMQQMVRDAAGSMTEKKLVARPALEASISGWADSDFGPGDKAVELRFLLGFTLTGTDDAFYAVPDDEEEADAYFDARATRFQTWSEAAAPLVKRCLTTEPDTIDLFFLYQDLFFDARQAGIAELVTMQMMSALRTAIDEAGLTPEHTTAVIGPAGTDDDLLVHVAVLDSKGEMVASTDMEHDPGLSAELEIDDIADALATIGFASIELCDGFDSDGKPRERMPYQLPG